MNRKYSNIMNNQLKMVAIFLVCCILSSCSTTSTGVTEVSTTQITIPLVTETTMVTISTDTISDEDYLDIEFCVDEDGYLSATYDDLTVHFNVPEIDIAELPVYSVDFNYRPSEVIMDDSIFQQLIWSWFSISLAEFERLDADTVEVNNRFISSYNSVEIEEFDDNVIGRITNIFPSKDICHYAVSYLFESETVYDNYHMYDFDFNEVRMDDDFSEYTFRETVDSIPLGIVNEGRRNLYRVDYEINGESLFGSLVSPDESVVFTDGDNIYRLNYYPISNYSIAQDAQEIISLEECINTVSNFVINEKIRQRCSCADIYAAELVYMIFYDFPDYCCVGAENANYYLIPVWAFYYQLGGVSQQARRGAVFVDAYTGEIY